MGDIEVVTTGDRHDLDGQARDALLLDDGQVVAGGWGVPVRWDGTVGTLPDGYDGALVSAVTGHMSSRMRWTSSRSTASRTAAHTPNPTCGCAMRDHPPG